MKFLIALTMVFFLGCEEDSSESTCSVEPCDTVSSSGAENDSETDSDPTPEEDLPLFVMPEAPDPNDYNPYSAVTGSDTLFDLTDAIALVKLVTAEYRKIDSSLNVVSLQKGVTEVRSYVWDPVTGNPIVSDQFGAVNHISLGGIETELVTLDSNDLIGGKFDQDRNYLYMDSDDFKLYQIPAGTTVPQEVMQLTASDILSHVCGDGIVIIQSAGINSVYRNGSLVMDEINGSVECLGLSGGFIHNSNPQNRLVFVNSSAESQYIEYSPRYLPYSHPIIALGNMMHHPSGAFVAASNVTVRKDFPKCDKIATDSNFKNLEIGSSKALLFINENLEPKVISCLSADFEYLHGDGGNFIVVEAGGKLLAANSNGWVSEEFEMQLDVPYLLALRNSTLYYNNNFGSNEMGFLNILTWQKTIIPTPADVSSLLPILPRH